MTYERLTEALAGYWEKPWSDLTADQQAKWFVATILAPKYQREAFDMAVGHPVPDDGQWSLNAPETRQSIAMKHDYQYDPVLRLLSWYNHALDAATWWSIASVTPHEAAMLLCEFDPHGDTSDPLNVTNLETGPNDFKRLSRVFQDVEQADTQARTLLQWLCIAVRKGIKYHSWIEDYALAASVRNGGEATSTQQHGADGTTEQETTMSETAPGTGISSPACAVFREMHNLTANELSIEFVKGDSGSIMMNVIARNTSRRVALVEIDLYDRRKGEMNIQAALLLGMAQNNIVRTTDKKARQISRLRKALKTHLGLRGDPFAHYQKSVGYRPLFTVSDKRGAADKRAKKEAERHTESYDQLHERVAHSEDAEQIDQSFDDDDDEAGNWIKKHDSVAPD